MTNNHTKLKSNLPFSPGNYLNSGTGYTPPLEVAHEQWTNNLCPGDGVYSPQGIRSLCGEARWRAVHQILHLHGSIPLHGLRSTVLSRELARHRVLSARPSSQALAYGPALTGLAQHPGERQRMPRLAHLGRPRPSSDRR